MSNRIGAADFIYSLKGNTEQMVNKLRPVVQEALDHLEYLETIVLDCQQSLDALEELQTKKEQDTK